MAEEDYELWAALMEDAQETVAPAAPVAPVAPAVPATLFIPEPPKPREPIFETPVVQEFVPVVEHVDPEDQTEFSANLFKEPQTNSILIPEIPDALQIISETSTGEIMKTGAIDIPLLTVTGSIPIITDSVEPIIDEVITASMGVSTTSGIPPIRSRSVMNSSARVGIMPIKNRRGEGSTVILVTTSILLITMGALVIAAYMFKLI